MPQSGSPPVWQGNIFQGPMTRVMDSDGGSTYESAFDWDKFKQTLPNSYQGWKDNPFMNKTGFAQEILGGPVAVSSPGWYIDPRYGIPVSYDDLPEWNGQRYGLSYSNHGSVGPQNVGKPISGADPTSFFSALSHMNWDRDNSSLAKSVLTGALGVGAFALGMPGLTGFMNAGGSFVPGLLSGGSYSLGAGFGGMGGTSPTAASASTTPSTGGGGMWDAISSWWNSPDMSSIMNTDWSGLGGATGAQADPLWGAIANSVSTPSAASGGFLDTLRGLGGGLYNSVSSNPMRWLGAGMQTLQTLDQSRAMRNFANQQNVNRQGFIDALRNTYTNPESFLSGPEYQAASRIALDALQRQDAAGGRLGNDVNRQRLMQDHAFAALQNYRTGLTNAFSGTPAALGDQSAGIGAQYNLLNSLLYENNRQSRPRTAISIGANGQPMITI